jgi:ABC-2 type transport system permease protein
VNVTTAIYGIVVRDLSRALRQKSRLLGGLARPFMWLLLVGSGYNAIARVDGVSSYHAFIYPGIVVMAVFFGAMLTSISTVYDREFGMLRLILSSPAGIPAMLAGRIVAATAIGVMQGAAVLICMPLVVPVSAREMAGAVAALFAAGVSSSVLGLLVAAPLRSVENFAGVINIVLFPLLFLSGALYPTAEMPAMLRTAARLNPVTYAVDLTRAALGQGAEFGVMRSLIALGSSTAIAFVLTVVIFDPEQRFTFRKARTPQRAARPGLG